MNTNAFTQELDNLTADVTAACEGRTLTELLDELDRLDTELENLGPLNTENARARSRVVRTQWAVRTAAGLA